MDGPGMRSCTPGFFLRTALAKLSLRHMYCVVHIPRQRQPREGEPGAAHFMERLSDCMAKSTLPMSCLRVKIRSLTSLPLQVVKVSSCKSGWGGEGVGGWGGEAGQVAKVSFCRGARGGAGRRVHASRFQQTAGSCAVFENETLGSRPSPHAPTFISRLPATSANR